MSKRALLLINVNQRGFCPSSRLFSFASRNSFNKAYKSSFSRSSSLISVVDLSQKKCCFASNAEVEQTPTLFPNFQRTVPVTNEEHELLLHREPETRDEQRLLNVAVLGLPNSGKSTLTNQILKWKVCTVSKKVHTTRENCRAVFIEEDTQIVFLDTPGLISTREKEKHRLEKSLLVDPEHALVESDMLLVVHDVSSKWTRKAIDPKVLKLLYKYPEKEAALVLNKVDLIKDKLRILDLTDELTEGFVGGIKCNKETRRQLSYKKKGIDKEELFRRMEMEEAKEHSKEHQNPVSSEETQQSVDRKNLTDYELYERVKGLKGWPHFSSVFMVSALYDDGVDDLRHYLIKSARPSPWRYNSSLVTDLSPKEIVLQTVKEKLLDNLHMEIPYLIQPRIEYWNVSSSGLLSLVVSLRPKFKHWMKLIIGERGETINKICQEAEQDLRNTFRFDVKLKVSVEEPRRTK